MPNNSSENKKLTEILSAEEVAYLLNILREGTVAWSGRKLALQRARKRVLEGTTQKGTPKYKYYWQCAKCRDWFRDVASLEVDHIDPVGSFKGDIQAYILRMYCRQENLQVLCVTCHAKKTVVGNASIRFERKSEKKNSANEQGQVREKELNPEKKD